MRLCIVPLSAALLFVSGCGSTKTFANDPKPAAPVAVTVYVNDARVSVAPGTVGGGEVTFMVTNQGTSTESLQVTGSGGSSPVASTGPINPQGATQLNVDLAAHQRYVISVASTGTEAQQATPTRIHPATLIVGDARPSSGANLQQP